MLFLQGSGRRDTVMTGRGMMVQNNVEKGHLHQDQVLG